MPQAYFAFKQFTIYHNKCAMKVNTDGCLLGAWAAANIKPKNILDIGAGSGLIGLMLAQRNPKAHVDLVEIEPHCAQQCIENTAQSPFAERVRIFNSAIQDFQSKIQYNLIVSNPPYFENNTLSPDEKRKLARHHTTLTLAELVLQATKFLHPTGSFCVIIPENRMLELVETARINGLKLQQAIAIRSLPNKPISRYLLAFGTREAPLETEEITIESSPRTYADPVRQWLAPFYLNL